MTSVWEDPDRSLGKAETFTRHAAASGAEIICFPEQFATGWDPHSSRNIMDREYGVVPSLQQFARDYGITVIGSFRERSTPCPRNTAAAIGKNGEILASYAKIHLFSPAGENVSFSPGTKLAVFAWGPLTFGIAICYDLRFPELFSAYAASGVQAVFVPAAWPAARLRHWELFIQARAAENQMYVIGVNTTGKNPVDTYAGASMTADPQGTIISRAGDAEQLLFSDIDPSAADSARASFPVRNDRKDPLYHTFVACNRHA